MKLPEQTDDCTLTLAGKDVRLSHLAKMFWPGLGISKRDLLQYYADVAPLLLPHLKGRAMVMKRYPNGAAGEFFFMKRIPDPHPAWIKTCAIEHASKSIISFPVIDDLAGLLWIVNLGCIDLNPWYGRCPNYAIPDFLNFDLDPMPGVAFSQVRECALLLRDALTELKMPSFPKTTGSKGIHIYVPLVAGPTQKEVWTFAKAFAQNLAARYPKLMTAQYRIEKRPAGRALVDYNQNAWGRTLASAYSVRPTAQAAVSTPLHWKEVEKGIEVDDFKLTNVRKRFARTGDLWAPMAPGAKKRFNLRTFL